MTLKALRRDFEAAREKIRDGRHPLSGSVLARVGSFMAMELMERADDRSLETVHRGGPIRFFHDYVQLCRSERGIPKDYRFKKSFEKLIARWDEDWNRTWNERTRYVSVSDVTDFQALAADLGREFAGAVVYPDYWDRFEGLIQDLFRRGAAGKALAVADAGVKLYPERADPHLYAGMIRLAMGDRPAAQEQMTRARDLDPGGPAGADSLGAWAGRFKSIGMIDVGLQLLHVARDLHPGAANLYETTGAFYLEKGEPEQAAVYCRKALEIAPELEGAREMLQEIEGRAEVAAGR